MEIQKDFKTRTKAAMFIVPQSPSYTHKLSVILKKSFAKIFHQSSAFTSYILFKNC